MENKHLGEMERKEKLFYNLGADGSIEFKNEEPIRVNKAVLAFHSKFFDDIFFGPAPQNQIYIERFDRATFKMFLDCLLGFKEYSLLDTLIIYPIAQEYEAKESLGKWIDALKPKVMDENVPLVLNFSAFYDNKELTDHVINFIKKNYGIVNFLENKKYSNSLDVLAMCELIDSVDLNSLIWTLVYEWGANFLKTSGKSDIKAFFVENGILEKISFSHFESAKALFDFHETSKKQLLNSDKILTYLNAKLFRSRKTLPDKSLWVKIDPGFCLKERIPLKSFDVAGNDPYANELDVVIWPNKIVFEPEATGLKIKARHLLRDKLNNGAKPQPNRNESLFFSYAPRDTWPAINSPLSALQLKEFDVNLINDSKIPVYKFVTYPVMKSTEIHLIEISYNFSSPCWILKASLDKSKYPVDNNDLYLTKKVCVLKKDEKYEENGEDEEEKEEEQEDD